MIVFPRPLRPSDEPKYKMFPSYNLHRHLMMVFVILATTVWSVSCRKSSPLLVEIGTKTGNRLHTAGSSPTSRMTFPSSSLSRSPSSSSVLAPTAAPTTTTTTSTTTSSPLSPPPRPHPMNQHHHPHHHLPPLVPEQLKNTQQVNTYRNLRRFILWTFPFLVGIGSCLGFHHLAHLFHRFVQWWSRNSWYPLTESQINLQTTVVTQVVNGPVITSISILFATLSSMTISSLYERQIVIRKCYAMELQALRLLNLWIQAIPEQISLPRAIGEDLLIQYTKQLYQESRDGQSSNNYEKIVTEEGSMRDPSGDIHLMALLAWCNDLILHPQGEGGSHKKLSSQPSPPIQIVGQIQAVLRQMLDQRHLRSLALSTVFPMVHWLTLTVLAAAIGISFLVATNQQEFIFIQGFPVRILWGVLMMSLTSLAILCYDLYSIYDGAYQAFTTTTTSSSA